MATIDERVVSMKFDNRQFEGGIASTLKSLSNLKEKLALPNAASGLESVEAASRRVTFSGMASGLEGISAKFVALSTVAIATLTNITNRAVDAGIQLGKSFTVDPIMEGFREYELKMGSIQTILANTSRHGTGLEEVTANLDALNEYADKTIYNFGDMTRNIGLFTNAGIKVDDATSMIKGFSNEAAASGTSAEGAAGAAYQLSQALSAGTIRLMDWRSLQNVGMGNKNMQLSLVELAEAMGTVSEAGLSGEEIQQDFNGSLEKGWLSADVMSNYLKIMAGDMSDTEMAALGLSDEVVAGFKKQQQTGEEAATKVRTFTQLMSTMKEAVGSSWSETFDIILGDFEAATDLFTGINDAIGPLIDKMGDTRNKLLQGWADGGGRAALLDGLVAGFEALKNVITPISDAFRDIFPPVTAQNLIDISNAFRDFMTSLIPGADTMNKLRSTFKGVFAVLDIGRMIIVEAAKMFFGLFKTVAGGTGSFLDITAGVGEFLVKVRDLIRDGAIVETFFKVLGTVVAIPIKGLGLLAGALSDMVKGLNFGDALNDRIGQLGNLGEVASSVFDILFKGDYSGGPWAEDSKIVTFLTNLREGFQELLEIVPTVMNILFKGDYDGGAWSEDHPIVTFLFKVREAFESFFNQGNFNAMLDLFNTGFLLGLVVLVKKFVGMFSDGLESADGLLDTFKGAVEGVTDTLGAMQTSLKADALIKIAGAIAILVASIVVLSMIDSDRLMSALAALSGTFVQLGLALMAFQAIATGPGVIKLPFVSAGLILLGGAILVFAAAVKVLSTIQWDELLRGMAGLAVMLGLLIGTVQLMSGMGTGMVTAGVGLVLVASAILILTNAVREFSILDWEAIAKGLTGVAALLVSLAIFTRLSAANAAGIGQGIGLILLATAMNMLLGVVEKFGNMPLPALAQGLISLAGAIAAIALAMQLVPANIAVTAVGLTILAGALLILTNVLGAMSQFSWPEIATSLTLLAGSLVILAGALMLMSGTFSGSAALVVATAALSLLAPVLIQLSALEWGSLVIGLTALAGTLVILGVAMVGMTAALPGAAALLVVAGALTLLLPVLIAMSQFTWAELGMGLVVLATSLGALAIAGALMAPVTPMLILLAGAIALFGVGVMAAGLGVALFAAGLTALGIAGAAAGAGLAAFITAILNVLPSVIASFGAVLTGIAVAIQVAAPAIIQALVTVIQQLIQAIITLAPEVGAAFNALIDLLISVVQTNFPRLMDTGWQMLLEFLGGVRDNIGDVIDVATEIIVAFLDGIDRNQQSILDKGAETIINFVNSLASTIEQKSGEMREAGGRLGMAIVDGMTGGLASKTGEFLGALGGLAQQGLSHFAGALGIRSPSRKFRELGEWAMMGLIVAFDNYGRKVTSSVGNVAHSAMDTLKKGVSNAGDLISDDFDLNPRIRPVVDLSDVHRGAREMSGAFVDPKISVNRSTGLANHNAQTWAQLRGEGDISGDKPVAPTNTFIQNNYSPKELAPSEIYRQTNSLLAMRERSYK